MRTNKEEPTTTLYEVKMDVVLITCMQAESQEQATKMFWDTWLKTAGNRRPLVEDLARLKTNFSALPQGDALLMQISGSARVKTVDDALTQLKEE